MQSFKNYFVIFILGNISFSTSFEIYKRQDMSDIFGGFIFRKLTLSELGLDIKSKLACTLVCTKYEACKSFYVHDGACVFGLLAEVTALVNGNFVDDPEYWQFMKTTGPGT